MFPLKFFSNLSIHSLNLVSHTPIPPPESTSVSHVYFLPSSLFSWSVSWVSVTRDERSIRPPPPPLLFPFPSLHRMKWCLVFLCLPSNLSFHVKLFEERREREGIEDHVQYFSHLLMIIRPSSLTSSVFSFSSWFLLCLIFYLSLLLSIFLALCFSLSLSIVWDVFLSVTELRL